MNRNLIFHHGRKLGLVSLILITALVFSVNNHSIAAPLSQDDIPVQATPLPLDVPILPTEPASGISQAAISYRQVTIGDDGITGGQEIAIFELPESVLETTTITHSTSQNIISGNAVACSSDDGATTTENGYLRTFVLEDFDILSDFEISAVSFGVEALTGVGQTLSVNLYTLSGSFIYANMTLIGTADIYLGAQNLTIIQLPITAVVPAGSTLVVEVDWPDTSGETGFFMGSNNLGQTAPSYFRSASCGIQEPTNLADIGYSTMHIVMNVTGSVGTPPPAWYKPMSSCIPAEEAPFAFINQPWGWLEGVASPNATIQASLKRGTSTVATASTQADALGWFSMDFLVNSSHTDILVGDRVIVVGGGLDSTITVPDLVGSIDPDQNRVAGQISGVSLPALGDVCVRMPAELNFESGKTWFDANGRFGIDFDGLVDIGVDHLAQVVYEDPNGNYVVQVLYPEGLNPRALINESRVEGVTRPDSQVTVLLRDANGIKGWAETTADKTGFYSTEIFSNGQKVLFALGDQVIVNKPGHTREIILNMHHISHIHPWTDRVFGTIYDANIAAEGSQGRIDVWNAIEKQWYTQYVWIEPDGQYGADFSGIANIQSGAMIRVWATAADGSQQAALGWDLHLGVSTSNDFVWGYTTAGSPVTINLYKSLVGTTLTDLIGTASTTAQSNGYFSAIVMSSGKQVDIIPSNALQVLTNEQLQTLYVGKVDAAIDVELDRLTISGPHNAVVHLEGRRPYFGSYVWREVYLDSNGMAVVDLSDANIWSGDVFDLTCYIVEVGQAVHTMVAAPGLPNRPLYLPLVTR